MTTYRPAEAFPPGEFLREELEECGWSQLDFAAITGKDARTISEVINGKRSITPETARAFAKALDTSAEVWLNLEAQYRLWIASADEDKENDISRRAVLYRYPIREMSRRGWIDDTANLKILEHQLAVFFCADSLNDVPCLSHAAKQTKELALTPTQSAWLFRARRLAEILTVESNSNKKLRTAVESLRLLLHTPEETKQVPRILSTAGVRYVIVAGLPGSKIDGVCFWLDRNSPVIAMSLRFDRIDNFWFVLRHEIEHVLRGHGKNEKLVDVKPDSDLESAFSADPNNLPQQEKVASEAAADFCVPHDRLADFIARVSPYYATTRIESFAGLIGVHPGLVVGQLHNRKELPHRNLRKLLVSVRSSITETAFTDGWSIMPQLNPK